MAELASRTGAAGLRDLMPSASEVLEMGRSWKDGVDVDEMNAVASALAHLTQALAQGKLGGMPVVCQPPDAGPRTAWSLKQLITVVETALDVLEPKVAAQEGG